MENSSARSANIRVKRYRIDETPENREIRVNIQRKNRRLAQRERKRVRHANESDERRKIRLTVHSQNMAEVCSKETESEHSARLEAKREHYRYSHSNKYSENIAVVENQTTSIDLNLNDELVQEQPQTHIFSFILY